MRSKRSLAAFEDRVIELRQAHARATIPGYLPYEAPGRTFTSGLKDFMLRLV
ncbi:MAG: hypothetical protein V4702_04370 [Patescibacteria group bacterium]